MKRFPSILIPAVPVTLILASLIFPPSCANTTQAPSGGPKDTIPPMLTAIRPMPGSVRVPVHKTQVVFEFDEYVQVKDPQGILLSPPLEKRPKYKLRGKSVVVWFESDLDSNTTYTLDLTGAIVDNNESNPFPGYTLVFSTGSAIDSMVMTGRVVDCNTLAPIKGATVMLYRDHADSAVLLHRPSAAVRTDDWGFFCFRNIKDTSYRLYAVQDESGNNIYDPESDRIAFHPEPVQPTLRVNDSLPELKKYEMKDTLHCQARQAQHELILFKETPHKQMLVNKERVGERTAYITFMAPHAVINSLRIQGVAQERLITQFNLVQDSLEIWINDPKRQADTLHMFVDYKRTDSTGVLKDTVEHLKLPKPKELMASARKSGRKDIKHEDTTAVYKVSVSPETVEKDGFEIEFKYPVVAGSMDSLRFRWLNPKQQESIGTYSWKQDSLNLRRYRITPEVKMLRGYEYFLKIPHRLFRDVNGYYNDSTEAKVTLPNDDKLSRLSLKLEQVGTRCIVDLLNEQRDKVLRSFIVRGDTTLDIPYLKAGKYSLRITEDPNENGLVDTGNLLEHKQPEKVRFYRLPSGKDILDIPDSAELTQTVNVTELFQ